MIYCTESLKGTGLLGSTELNIYYRQGPANRIVN